MKRINLVHFTALSVLVVLCLICTSTTKHPSVALANPLGPTGTIIIDSTGRASNDDRSNKNNLQTIVVTSTGAAAATTTHSIKNRTPVSEESAVVWSEWSQWSSCVDKNGVCDATRLHTRLRKCVSQHTGDKVDPNQCRQRFNMLDLDLEVDDCARSCPLQPNDDVSGPTSNKKSSVKQGRKLRAGDISDMFRESAVNYPEDEIGRLLKAIPDNVKELYNVINTKLDPHINLTERVASGGGDDDTTSDEYTGGIREESICKSVTRNIYPREASHQNSLVYIPNNYEFMQVIQADICQHPNEECSHLQSSLPDGMTSTCYQKYAYKKLLYMDPSDKRLASDLFRYPSCCSCYIRTMPLDLRSSVSNKKASVSSPSSSSSAAPASALSVVSSTPASSDKLYLEDTLSRNETELTITTTANVTRNASGPIKRSHTRNEKAGEQYTILPESSNNKTQWVLGE